MSMPCLCCKDGILSILRVLGSEVPQCMHEHTGENLGQPEIGRVQHRGRAVHS
jgi:hypothetical protein